MSVAEMFSDFVGTLAISNTETISTRYGELTSALNKQFRDTESKTANTLQVGSFGRKTGINGIFKTCIFKSRFPVIHTLFQIRNPFFRCGWVNVKNNGFFRFNQFTTFVFFNIFI